VGQPTKDNHRISRRLSFRFWRRGEKGAKLSVRVHAAGSTGLYGYVHFNHLILAICRDSHIQVFWWVMYAVPLDAAATFILNSSTSEQK
jgi:hypothetical protein